MPLTIRNERIAAQEASTMSEAVQRDLQSRANIEPKLPSNVQPSPEASIDASKPQTVSELVREVPEVSEKALPDNWVEKIRKYIPAEVLVAWATTKQLMDVLFEGAVDKPNEVTTFTVVWGGVLLLSILA